MIELRWLKRTVPPKVADPIQYKDMGYEERVLQFRTQVLQMGNGYTTDVNGALHCYQRPMGMAWTEWMDVPEAQEPSLAARDTDQPKEKP